MMTLEACWARSTAQRSTNLQLRRGIEGAEPIGIERWAELDAAAMRSRLSTVMLWRGSLGSPQAVIGTGASTACFFLPYQDPDQRVRDRFGHRQPICGVSGP